jgi:hypothetical protein
MFNYFKKMIRYIIKFGIEQFAPSLMHYSPISYMKDGLITSHHFNATNEKFFESAFLESRIEFTNLHSLYNEWRLYIAAVLTERAFLKVIPNDFIFIECGVGMGMNNFLSKPI